MPLPISESLGVAPEAFDATGAFDAMLDLDTDLYIDPFLLRRCRIPELAGSHARLCAYFSGIQETLSQATYGDWRCRSAIERLQKGEARDICIGISANGTSGSGIGAKTAEDTATTIRALWDLDVRDPDLFEILPFIQDGIGPDRMSDWVATVIRSDLLAFSERVFQSLGGFQGEIIEGGRRYLVPRNPVTRGATIVVPREILRRMPTVLDWRESDRLPALRGRSSGPRSPASAGPRIVSTMKELSWSQFGKLRTEQKLERFLRHPELIERLLVSYRMRSPEPYDFAEDSRAVLVWYRKIRQFTDHRPLPAPPKTDFNGLLDFTDAALKEFRWYVENVATQQLFYKGTTPKNALTFARMFLGAWDRRHRIAGSPFLVPEPENDGFRVSSRFPHGHLMVVVGLIRDPGLPARIARAIRSLPRTGRGQVMVVGIDTEQGFAKLWSQVRQPWLTREQAGDLSFHVVAATFATFRRSVGTTLTRARSAPPKGPEDASPARPVQAPDRTQPKDTAKVKKVEAKAAKKGKVAATTGRSWPCPIRGCPLTMVSAAELDLHVADYHATIAATWACSECGHKSGRIVDAAHHVESAHRGLRVHFRFTAERRVTTFEEVNASWRPSPAQKVKVKQRKTRAPKTIACEECGKLFRAVPDMKSHHHAVHARQTLHR